MFGTRISLSLSRIFRFRRRRPTRANDVAHVSFSTRPAPSKSRPLSSYIESANTTSDPSPRRRSLFPAFKSPVAQSSLHTSPVIAHHRSTPPPIIIIGQDRSQSTFPLPPAPAAPGDARPQVPVDGVSRLESAPAPITDSGCLPETPLSTCPTLITEVTEGVTVPVVPREQGATLDTLDRDAVGPEIDDSERIPDLPSTGRFEPRKVSRHRSLFTPRPVRVNVNRFSLPASPTAANAKQSRRDSKRMSVTSTASGSAKKERWTTRMSRELNKPETQEILNLLTSYYPPMY